MNEYIELPLDLAIAVSRTLKMNSITPSNDLLGLSPICFTKEELNSIKKLTVVNPTRNYFSGINYLENIEELIISTNGSGAVTTITDDDIKKIEKLSHLKKLAITNQRGITSLDLSNLQSINELEITNNQKLISIIGLDKLKEIKTIIIKDNHSLRDVIGLDNIISLQKLSIYNNSYSTNKYNGLNNIIKNNNLDNLELSLLDFSDAIGYNSETYNIDMEALQKMALIKSKFIESYKDEYRSISPEMAMTFHQECLSLLYNKKISSNTTDYNDRLTSIVSIEEYLSRNILYGKGENICDSYNAIMNGKATCEGYAYAMAYLLKLSNLDAHLVLCARDNVHIPTKQQGFPDDGYHFIVCIDAVGGLYTDPCWDAAMYQSGVSNYLPFTLLNSSEINKTHRVLTKEVCNIKISREEVKKMLNSERKTL